MDSEPVDQRETPIYHKRPPLGEPRFEKIKRERLAVEFIGVESDSKLNSGFNMTIKLVNDHRALVGAKELQVDQSVVRMVDIANWPKVVKDIGGEITEDNDAFLDVGDTDLIFVKVNFARLKSNKTDLFYTFYATSHELGHVFTPNLAEYSFHLSEAFADSIAQMSVNNSDVFDMFNGVGSSKKMNEEKKEYVAKTKPSVESTLVTNEQILLIEPNDKILGLTRIPQLNLLAVMMSSLSPNDVNEFWKLAYAGETSGLKIFVSKHFGSKVESMLASKNQEYSAKEIIDEIQKR